MPKLEIYLSRYLSDFLRFLFQAIEDSHPFSLLPHLDDVNRIFSENKMETIMEKLNELDTEWSRSTIKTLLKCVSYI